LKEVDLGRGETRYKFFWTDKKIDPYEVSIYKENLINYGSSYKQVEMITQKND
jgi:hypothetical protein